ncbi:hypothetical protein [Luteococcus sanguinis]|uniref:Uncharacterized protein n=1 Tax=Luteococcus sanguinis TaxID=174038 RepID=A0ABW1X0B2_9ACTN
MDEADQLGLSVTDNPRNHQFRAGNAILVCTFEKMVNGAPSSAWPGRRAGPCENRHR